MRPGRIAVCIGELVLHGVAPADRHRVGEALQRELARLLAGRGLPTRPPDPGAAERLDVGAVPAGAPEALGRQVARAVFRGLHRAGGAS